jgi:hypothetical protein
MIKTILFFGKKVQVGCDETCSKAWGINNRPNIQLDATDPDDVVFLSDAELGIAPVDPRTYEGGHAKPRPGDTIPNKWCVRECERCHMSKIGKELILPNFSKRIYNIPSKHEK